MGPKHQQDFVGIFVCLFVFVFVKLLSDSSSWPRQRAIDSEASDAFYCSEGWFERQGFQWTTYSHPGLCARGHLRLFLSSPELFSTSMRLGKKLWHPRGVPCNNVTLYYMGNGPRFRFLRKRRKCDNEYNLIPRHWSSLQKWESQPKDCISILSSPSLLRLPRKFFSFCWNCSSNSEMPLTISKQWLETENESLGLTSCFCVSTFSNCQGVNSISDFAHLQIING